MSEEAEALASELSPPPAASFGRSRPPLLPGGTTLNLPPAEKDGGEKPEGDEDASTGIDSKESTIGSDAEGGGFKEFSFGTTNGCPLPFKIPPVAPVSPDAAAGRAAPSFDEVMTAGPETPAPTPEGTEAAPPATATGTALVTSEAPEASSPPPAAAEAAAAPVPALSALAARAPAAIAEFGGGGGHGNPGSQGGPNKKAASLPDSDEEGGCEFTFGNTTPLELPDAAQLAQLQRQLSQQQPARLDTGGGLRRAGSALSTHAAPQILTSTPRSAREAHKALASVSEHITATPPQSPLTPQQPPPPSMPPQAMYVQPFPGQVQGTCYAQTQPQQMQVLDQFGVPHVVEMQYGAPQVMQPMYAHQQQYPQSQDYHSHGEAWHYAQQAAAAQAAADLEAASPGSYGEASPGSYAEASQGGYGPYFGDKAQTTVAKKGEGFWDCCTAPRMKLVGSFGCIALLLLVGVMIITALAAKG